MRLRHLLPGCALAALLAAPAGAMTLQDLADGGSFMSGDGSIMFDNFSVRTGGGLQDDLSRYRVVVMEDGFKIKGKRANGNGVLKLQFDATGSGLDGASSAVGSRRGQGRLDTVVRDGAVRLAKLRNNDSDTYASMSSVQVSQRLKLRRAHNARFKTTAGFSTSGGTISVPEPGTAWLAAAGLFGVAARMRRRS